MKRIILFIAVLWSVSASTQSVRDYKLLGEGARRISIADTSYVGYDQDIIPNSSTIRKGLDNVYDAGRGRGLYGQITMLDSSNTAGSTISRGKVRIRIAGFGDSMGGYVFTPLYNRLLAKYGNGGGIMGLQTATGGGGTHDNTNEGQYWFNGRWFYINGSGSLEFLIGNGRQQCNIIKVYYVKESGGGEFQVQLNNGSGYVNEGSVIDTDSTETGAGILTINKTPNAYGVKINQVSGNVKIIMIVAINEPLNYDGVTLLGMNIGGLPWTTAVQTDTAITNPVFRDLGITHATFMVREAGDLYENFSPWLKNFKKASPKTSWMLCGAFPQESNDNLNIIDNKSLQRIAIEEDQLYLDCYSPFKNWNTIDSVGLGGDGLHVNSIAGFMMAGQAYAVWGFDNIINSNDYLGVTKFGNVRLNNSRLLEFHGSNNDGFPNGAILADPSGNDLTVRLRNSFYFANLSGGYYSNFNSANGFSILTNSTTRGFNFNSGAIGYYRVNDTLTGVFSNPGAGTRQHFTAKSGILSGLYVGPIAGKYPSAGAVVEFESSTGGFLMPRLNTTQLNAVPAQNGNMAYNLDSSGVFVYRTASSAWRRLRFSDEIQTVAPTANPGDSTTNIATTAFVDKVKDSLASVIPAILTQTTTLDFPSTAVGTSQDLTITITGAALGDPVTVGKVGGYACCDSTAFIAFVSSANTVTVRFINLSAVPIDPAADNFKVKVLK